MKDVNGELLSLEKVLKSIMSSSFFLLLFTLKGLAIITLLFASVAPFLHQIV